MGSKFTNNSTHFNMPYFLEEIIEEGSSWLCTHNNITYQTALLYNKETIIPGVSRSSLLRIGILNLDSPTRGLQYYNVLKAVIKYTDSGDTPYYIMSIDIGRPIAMEVIVTPIQHYKLDRDKLALLPPEDIPPLLLEYKPESTTDTNNNVVINKNYKRKYYNKHTVLDVAKFGFSVRITSLLNTIEYNIDKMLLESNILIHHYANTNERLQVIAVMNMDLFSILTKNGTEPGLLSTTTYDVLCVCTRSLVTKWDLLLIPMLHDDPAMSNVVDYTLRGEVYPLYTNCTFRLYNIQELLPKAPLPEPELIDPTLDPDAEIEEEVEVEEIIPEEPVEEIDPTLDPDAEIEEEVEVEEIIPEEPVEEIDPGFTRPHGLTIDQIQEIIAGLEQDGDTLTEDEIEAYVQKWIEEKEKAEQEQQESKDETVTTPNTEGEEVDSTEESKDESGDIAEEQLIPEGEVNESEKDADEMADQDDEEEINQDEESTPEGREEGTEVEGDAPTTEGGNESIP